MAAEVVWEPTALLQLRQILAYIATDNPRAAERMADRLISAAEALSELPHRGRSLGRGVRQLVTVRPYILRYRVVGEEVRIVSVRHGARRPLR